MKKIEYFLHVNENGNMIFQNSFLDDTLRARIRTTRVRSEGCPEIQASILYLQGRENYRDLLFCTNRTVPLYFKEALSTIEQINNGDINV